MLSLSKKLFKSAYTNFIQRISQEEKTSHFCILRQKRCQKAFIYRIIQRAENRLGSKGRIGSGKK